MSRNGTSGSSTGRSDPSGSARVTMLSRALMPAALAAMLLAAGVDAQARGDRRPSPQERQEMMERARARMHQMIRERLELDDEGSTRLAQVMDGFQERRRELARSEQATRRRVEAVLLEGGEDQDAARELLDRLVELREEESALFRDEQAALLQVLTPTQVLELHALREQIARRMRALRGRRGGEGPGEWRPGPGPAER